MNVNDIVNQFTIPFLPLIAIPFFFLKKPFRKKEKPFSNRKQPQMWKPLRCEVKDFLSHFFFSLCCFHIYVLDCLYTKTFKHQKGRAIHNRLFFFAMPNTVSVYYLFVVADAVVVVTTDASSADDDDDDDRDGNGSRTTGVFDDFSCAWDPLVDKL